MQRVGLVPICWAMSDKQIDLDQTDYRRKPRKREPLLAYGAGSRIKWFLTMFAVSLAVGAVMWFVVYLGIKPVTEALWSLTLAD